MAYSYGAPSPLPSLASSTPTPASAASPLPSLSPSLSSPDLALLSALSSPSTQPALRASTALQAVDPIARVLLDPRATVQDPPTAKLALSAFATAYPYLFRYACQSGDQPWWTRIVQLKTAALTSWREGTVGQKTAAVKVIQRIMQTQTDPPAPADPRLAARTAPSQEPSLSLCRPNHPFLKIALLEDEATKLLQEMITTLFTCTNGDVVSALVTSLTHLVKQRGQFVQLVVTALTNWAPTTMAGQTFTQIKSVEKVVKISLTHLLKTSVATAYQPQITQFLSTQAARMDAAAAEHKKRREDDASRKRASLSTQIGEHATKRRRLNEGGAEGSPSSDPLGAVRAFRTADDSAATTAGGTGQAALDLSRIPVAADLPLDVVVDLVVRTIEGARDGILERAIERVRSALPSGEVNGISGSQGEPAASGPADGRDPSSSPSSVNPFAASNGTASTGANNGTQDSAPIKVDLLKLDLGEEELSIKAEVPPEPAPEAESVEPEDHSVSLSASLLAQSATEPFDSPLLDLSRSARHALVHSTLRRICSAGSDGGVNEGVWIPLVSRLITRGLESGAFLDEQGPAAAAADEDGEGHRQGGESDEVKERRARGAKLREVLFGYVTRDLQNRMELARLWLNEEWYASKRLNYTTNRPYDHYLRRFLSHICEHSSNEDKALYRFMIDLPEIPVSELERLEGMCLNVDQMQLGFSTLRELAILRPSVRGPALDVLLGLTTHADKRIRNAAIMSVKKWVPDVKELSGIIVSFALSLLERLQVEPVKPEDGADGANGAAGDVPAADEAKKEGEDEGGEAEMAMDDTPPPEEPKAPFALVREGKVVDRLAPPTTIGEVTQHVELLLALCVKEPDLLNPLFAGYAKMTPFAKESLHELITPLIRSLGIKHPGILHLFGAFPEGSDALLLKMVEILADKQKLPTQIVQLIKNVAAERDLDSRIYALIMPDCHKNEIIKYLPRVVSLLDGTPQQKAAIRSIFLSIIAPPAHFSSVNSLRTRSDSLSPVELMLFLHKHDKEIGIKCTIEAIAICFSMADGFRPEILAAFMQQVVDEPVLPNLFLRTVIQAVTTYKSLQPFVSTTLLSRLISKRIWETPALWEGFIRCAKAIAPASFAALLQLPKEWLEDLVKKQPAMRAPLRDYVLKKGGVANARTAGILEALAEPDATANGAMGARSESPAGGAGSATPPPGPGQTAPVRG